MDSTGLAPCSGAPRQTIINRLFLPGNYGNQSKRAETLASRLAAPPSRPVVIRYRPKKNTALQAACFLVDSTGLAPCSGAPRQTIINRLFLPSNYGNHSKRAKTLASRLAAPPSRPVVIRYRPKKNTALQAACFFGGLDRARTCDLVHVKHAL